MLSALKLSIPVQLRSDTHVLEPDSSHCQHESAPLNNIAVKFDSSSRHLNVSFHSSHNDILFHTYKENSPANNPIALTVSTTRAACSVSHFWLPPLLQS
jgi:hypothetical protein